MSKRAALGTCRLTGRSGRYVNAHILPLALTRLSPSGEKYVEGGIELDGTATRVVRRPTSWYDRRLVTAEGERILAGIDDIAIAELRRLKLVWSGWEGKLSLDTDDFLVAQGNLDTDELPLADGQKYARTLVFENGEALRLFFLSIVWRVAASSLSECRFARLMDGEVEDLRGRIASRQPGAPIDYPIQLFQLITRGHQFNRLPILETSRVPNRDTLELVGVPCVRIYLDGLVAYVYLPHRIIGAGSLFFDFCIGVGDFVLVMTHEFERSRTRNNLIEQMLVSSLGQRGVKWSRTQIASAIKDALQRDPQLLCEQPSSQAHPK